VDAKLPILAHRDEIVGAVRCHQAVVIAGETGSGKTTVVPRFLLEAGADCGGLIGVTEPRRIAAVSVANYVAGELGEEVGGTVGYQIRHENRTDPKATRIKYMTEGVLLREMLADPMLRKYGVIVLDEVHERNVNQDLLLALVKDLMPRRPDLRVIAMSATIDEERFAAYLGAPIVRIKGRMFPVQIEYAFETPSDHVEAAVAMTEEMLRRTIGDVLVFMPDYESIRQTMELLAETPPVKVGNVQVRPLFGSQSPDEQRAVFDREGRSVIVATNVAETSVTLDGVTAVVDTGLVKEMRYYPSTSMSALKVVRHSKAGCDQRAGRAGRTAPGICARLYAKDDYEDRRPFTVPEILRSSLDQVFLQLRAMDIEERTILSFDFPEAPPLALWKDARSTLELLGALDDDGELTDDGELMAEIPLPPMVTRMIFTARRHGCVAAVTTVAASFSTRPVFVRPPGQEDDADAAHRQFRDPRSDFQTLLTAVRRWRSAGDRKAFAERNYLHPRALEEIEAVEKQIAAILDEHGIATSTGTSHEDVGKAIASGLVANLLESDGGRAYKGRKHGGIFIFPGSSLYGRQPPKHIVAAEIVETKRKYARGVQEVPTRWLEDILGRPSHRHRRRKKERFRNRGRR
jgi:ATP-dependent helicase HrpA